MYHATSRITESTVKKISAFKHLQQQEQQLTKANQWLVTTAENGIKRKMSQRKLQVRNTLRIPIALKKLEISTAKRQMSFFNAI